MTSREEPAGIEASLTMKTSFDPSSLSIKILAVIPEVDLFAIVIPITIVSRAAEPDPAGTVYNVVFEVPTLGTQNLLKSLAIVIFPLLCFFLYL
jgi:hypothetical protein